MLAQLEAFHLVAHQYSEVLETVKNTPEWRSWAKETLLNYQDAIQSGKDGMARMGLVLGLAVFILRRVQQNDFTFTLPGRMGFLPDVENRELLNLSGSLRKWASPTEEVVSRVTALADTIGPDHHEKVSSLLKSIAAYFKALLRQDWDDLELVTSHMNLVTTTRESGDLVEHIAKIAREIYNSLNEFSEGFSIESLSQSTEEIPDAVVKLNSVISKLEDAANGNLDELERLSRENGEHKQYIDESKKIVIECIQEIDHLAQENPECADTLAMVRQTLTDEVTANLDQLSAQNQRTGELAMSMIANQGFQDLTGQTLKRVITFIETLQNQLVVLLQKYSKNYQGRSPGAVSINREAPPAPTTKSQGEVDQLLADLGF